MLAIYHGHYSDSGTAWEIGFAYSTTCIDTSNVACLLLDATTILNSQILVR